MPLRITGVTWLAAGPADRLRSWAMPRVAATVLLVLTLGGGLVGVTRAALATSTVVLVCDWHETRQLADRRWRVGRRTWEEQNPVLGPTPGTAAVDRYFLVVAALNIALWLVLPRRWKLIVPLLLLAWEVRTVLVNVGQGLGVCHL
jgi:hypothetical protein